MGALDTKSRSNYATSLGQNLTLHLGVIKHHRASSLKSTWVKTLPMEDDSLLVKVGLACTIVSCNLTVVLSKSQNYNLAHNKAWKGFFSGDDYMRRKKWNINTMRTKRVSFIIHCVVEVLVLWGLETDV